MTAPELDPVALASKALFVYSEADDNDNDYVRVGFVKALAQAVIDLTAERGALVALLEDRDEQVGRVEALADDLVADAQYVAGVLPGKDGRNRAGERVAAAQRIRAALNGGDHA